MPKTEQLLDQPEQLTDADPVINQINEETIKHEQNLAHFLSLVKPDDSPKKMLEVLISLNLSSAEMEAMLSDFEYINNLIGAAN